MDLAADRGHHMPGEDWQVSPVRVRGNIYRPQEVNLLSQDTRSFFFLGPHLQHMKLSV